jgi:dihydrodiol dehydrogenase / D-xylose 1-dehydrogenase (NADP)
MAIRWGVCAAGRIAHDFIGAVRSLPAAEHQIAAVAARSLDRARQFASGHSVQKAYGSYEDLAKDPG